MSESINVLTNLDTLGVSLVRRGANKRKFAITKSEAVMDEKSLELLSTVLKEAGYDGEDKLAALIEKAITDDKARNAVQGALRILNAFRDNPEIKKLADMLAAAVGGGEGGESGGDKYPTPKAKAAAKKPEENMDDKKYPQPMMKALEGMPDEQRAAFEPVIKAMWEASESAASERIQKAEERATKTEEVLKSERNERLSKEFIAKAATEYSHVPGKPEELGAILKSLNDASPELRSKVEGVLKAAEAILKEGAVLVEKGRAGEGTGSDDPWSNIEKAADAAAAQ